MKQNHEVVLYGILLFLFLAPVVNSAESLPVITLNDTNDPPYRTLNNDGFVDVVLLEIFKRIGYQVKTVSLPAERGLLNANEGIVDGEVNRIKGIDREYTNLRRVKERLRDSDFCVLSKNADIVNTPEVLKTQVVGYIKGWKIYDKMMSGAKNTVTANNTQQLFRLLKIGRIDVVLYTCAQGFYLAKKYGIENVVELTPKLKQRGMYIYLNKKHENLLPALSNALQSVKREGLYEAWYEEKIMPHLHQ